MLHSEKLELMNRVLDPFTIIFSEHVTATSYKMVHKIADRGKLCTDENFIKENVGSR